MAASESRTHWGHCHGSSSRSTRPSWRTRPPPRVPGPLPTGHSTIRGGRCGQVSLPTAFSVLPVRRDIAAPPPSPGSRGALALAPAAPRPRGASTASVPGAFLLSQQRFWRSRVKPTSRSLFPRARSCLAFSVSCPAFPLHASVPQAHARTREAGRAEAG